LTLPSDTRARHKVTESGKQEAAKIHVVHAHLLESITERMGHLAEICELLKREGLPPNEVSKKPIPLLSASSIGSHHFCFILQIK
jgi:hypothetical protein